MKKHQITITVLTLTLLILLVGCNKQSMDKKSNVQERLNIQNLPEEQVSENEIEALSQAINDEYKARATYTKVIEKFGEIKPFTNIIQSEQNHIDALKTIYNKYDLKIPKDEWPSKAPTYDSIKEACEAGVQAEIENAELYDEILSKTDNKDITQVFKRLQSASQEKHLPAFKRCSK